MPQILKNEVKEKILRGALDGFLDKGYTSTSMQEIARRAGIAAGNIYNYFRNKQEVFSTLIGPVLAEVKAIFGIRESDLVRYGMVDGMEFAQQKMDAFIRLYQSNREVFVLLFEKSDNTKFETTKADVIFSLSSAIILAKNTFSPNHATPEQEILIKAFATAFISGVISILTAGGDEAVKLNALHQFLPFMRSKLINNLR